MRVVAYVTTGHPKLDAFVGQLRAVLERFKASGAQRFDYAIVDATDEDQKETAKKAGLKPFELLVGDSGTPITITGFMGLSFDYGPEHDTISVLSPEITKGLEYWVASKVREVRARAEGTKHRIGVLTGHDEIKLSEPNLVPANNPLHPDIQSILAKYFPYNELRDVDLGRNGGAGIDPSFEALLITQPAKDLTEDELARIDDFVISGKTLAVVASAVNVAAGDPTMSATLSTHGLEKLLSGYGIEMRKDVLEDFGRPFGIMVQTGTSSEPSRARFPAILDVADDERFTGSETLLDSTFPLFLRIPRVPFPYASSLVLHPEKQPEIGREKFRVLARSTPKTARETSAVVDLKVMRRWQPGGELAQYDIAASVEGKLRGAFPERSGRHAPKPGAPGARPPRVLVLSTSQFFANPFARAAGGDEMLQQLAMPYAQQLLTNTILVAKNMLDWMTSDDELTACAGLPNGK
jgi:hypothetical protein